MKIKSLVFGQHIILYQVRFKNRERNKWVCYNTVFHKCDNVIVIEKIVWFTKLEHGLARYAYENSLGNTITYFKSNKQQSILLHFCREMYYNVRSMRFDNILQYPNSYTFLRIVNYVKWAKINIAAGALK
jgi:hypothetical protein